MKSFLTSLIFSFSCLVLHAQQDRFIYLQTENKEPFFVKLDNKIFNSSATGYLIIPKLSEGSYSMVIGFAQSHAEQEFNCSIKNKDIGYIIRNSADSKVQLVNVQTLGVIVPGYVINKPVMEYEKVSDPFSTMLANAVHDSTILRKDIVEVVPEKTEITSAPDTVKAVVSAELATQDNKPDSVGDIVKSILVSNDSATILKDSMAIVITRPEITKTDELLKLDSIKAEIPIVILEDRSIVNTQKDSTGIEIKDVVSTPQIILLDTNRIEVNSDVTANKLDSAQNVPIVNDVVVKSKKKKSKIVDEIKLEISKSKDKNPVNSDSVFQNQDLAVITMPNAEQGSVRSKKKKTKETKVDTVSNIQPEIAKGSDPKIMDVKKDSVFVPVTNNEEVAVKSKKKKSKTNINSAQPKEVDITVKTKVTSLPAIDGKPNVEEENNITKVGSVKRKSKKTTKKGMEMTYVDDQVMFQDTIKLLIPIDLTNNSNLVKAQSKVTSPVFLEDKPDITVKIKSDKKAKKEQEIIKEGNKIPVIKAVMVNSDCKNFANDDDFLKMRKKMVAEDKEVDMVKAARKVFKTKCFTTEQIKNLSVLFLKDEQRFLFFDAAYAFVADSELFHTLEKQLTVTEYINRFKAMVKK